MDSSRSHFPPAEYASRLEKVRDVMARRGLDALVVSAPENILYLSGYQTKAVFTFQFLLVETGRPMHLFTRQMESANAEMAQQLGQIDGYTLFQDDEDPLSAALAFLRAGLPDGARVGLETASWTMPADRARGLIEGLTATHWEDASALVDRVRLVKSPAEMDLIREAGRLGDGMADAACAAVRAGASEADIAQVVLSRMVQDGSEYPGSWPNIMAGRRTGMIHAAWDYEAIAKDDHVIMEITGVKARYHAPSFRSVLVGDPPAILRQTAEAMAAAHAAAVASIVPGRPMRVINEAAQAVLARHALPCKFSRRTGYTLGLGFPPSWGAQWQIGLNSLVEDPLEIGMAFHIVVVGHFDDGRALSVGCTVGLTADGAERMTRGGLFDHTA